MGILNLIDVEELKKDMFISMRGGKKAQILKKFNNALIDQISLKGAWDIIGELTKKNPIFFMNRLYSDLIEKFFRKIFKDRFTRSDQLYEMDKYILTNYCLYEGEKIETDITGFFYINKVRFERHLFLTNYRVIVTGQPKTETSTRTSMKPSILRAAYRASLRSSRIGNVKKRLATNGLENSPEKNGVWGYDFPLTNITDIKVIKEGKKNKLKALTYTARKENKKIKVKILPLIDNKEDEDMLIDDLFSKIKLLLQKYQ